MQRFVIAAFVMLGVLSVVAWRMQARPLETGKTVIVWVTDDNPARRGQVELFNRLHNDLELRLDPTNTGTEKTIVQCLAGVGPDLFDCYDASDLAAFVKSGIAWDVTDQLRQAAVDPLKDEWSVLRPLVSYNGRIYGCGDNTSVNGIWFNKAAFAAARLPYPKGRWTWKEFLPVAQSLTLRDSKGRIKQFGFLLDWSVTWQQFIWQWGGRVYCEDGTRCIVDSPAATAGVQFMQDLVYKYKVAPTPIEEQAASQGGWGAGNVNLFGAGRVAMAVGARWWLCSLRDFTDLRLGVVECPHGRYRVFCGYGRATVINSASPRRAQALELLKYQAGKDYNELVNAQADAIAPVIEYCYTDSFLHNPKYPKEDFNALWRDITRVARPVESSPFINLKVANRIFQKQLDLIKSNQKTAREGMRDAAQQINMQIKKNIESDPELRAKYEEMTGRKTY